MANEIVVPLVGDEKPLVSAFNRVGSAADALQSDLRGINGAARDASGGMDRAVDSADTLDTRAMGFRDTLTGVQDGFQGLTNDSDSLMESLLLIGFGIGDLASGFVNLIGPAIKSFGTWIASTTVFQWGLNAAQTAWNAITAAGAAVMNLLNAAMRANPILFIVGLVFTLVAAFATLWANSEGFRNFFIGMWNGIKTAVGAVIDWIKNAWNGIPGFFRGVVDAIGRVFSGIGNAISGAFKGAVNFVINGINAIISGINLLIRGMNAVNPFGDIPSIPKIPRLHTGGVVPGMLGSEQLAILQAGERVIPRGQSGNQGSTINFGDNVDSAFASAFMMLVRSGDITIS